MKLRVPYWATAGYTVSVNGEVVIENPEVSSYVEIERELADGDVVAINMPYTMHLDKTPDNAVIIAADTVVALNDNILGKPGDENEAFAMLKNLSGKVHRVYTGGFMYDKPTLGKRCFCAPAAVHMSPMADE